ncbi:MULTISPECIES: SCO1664 family protein [unclassified Nocardioides]|uniref:SCO1664 family protein n=1 Tax=unclassified Nocardioides TaxID=2615069 RepID=UPI0026650A71|nr:SCO1664 family protein [Nocardioides sp. Arc9.136]WKN50510.1 SCO1664 family protein [Nocardioides sp. Arc9.136]
MSHTEPPAVDLLSDELVLHGRIMPASNATFLGEVGDVKVVYKPISGERPLWDFPYGDLASREVAAYLVSEATGWDVVPQTWLREGPHGRGMVQRWQEPDPEQAAVEIVAHGEVPPGFLHVFDGVDGRDLPVSLVHEDSTALRRMAVFDVVVNNADRKGGHVLEMTSGHRYGVDHGITFHHEHKLRTVLWGWLGEPLRDEDVEVVQRVRGALAGSLGEALSTLLTDLEIDALDRRCARLLARGVMPAPHGEMPAIPWPPF